MIPKIARELESFAITDEATMSQAVSLLSLANKELDRLTTDREKLTKPMNEALKQIRSRYKPAESRLEGAISVLRKLMTLYQTGKTDQALRKAEKIAGRVGAGKGSLKPETAMDKIAEIDTPAIQVKTEAGMVSFRAVTTYEVENIKDVPYEYLEVDMTKVRNAFMKQNIRIKGINYSTEQQPINRR